MHACERGPMDEVRRKDLTIGTLAVVRGARISHIPGLKPEIRQTSEPWSNRSGR